uniref:ESPR domain-containing protein n=1 Tax=Enterobacter chuandaensis TaxID=2497875 RepID=UPI003D6F65CD
MNKIYRLVWDSSRQMLIPVSELSPSHGKNSVVGAVKEKGHGVFRLKKLYIALAALQGLLFVPQANAYIQLDGGQLCTSADVQSGLCSTNGDGSTDGTIVIGQGARAARNSVVVGVKAFAYSSDSVAIGSSARTEGQQGIAIGINTTAGGNNSIVIGGASKATTRMGVSLGYNNQITKNLSADTYDFNMMAFGNDNTINAGGKAMTIGSQNKISDSVSANGTDPGTFAMGNGNVIDESHASYLYGGSSSINKSINSILIGQYSTINNAENAIIMGGNSVVSAKNGMALGNTASVSATNAIAMGNSTSATHANSVALGAGSASETAVGTSSVTLGGKSYSFAGATAGSTVSIGTSGTDGTKRTLTNLAAGRLTAASTDGVNGSQLYATNTALNTLYGDVNALADDALLWDASKNAYSATHGTATKNKITNVAIGDLNSSSTDAVNGSQLFATNQIVDNNTKNIENNTKAITTLADTPLTFKGNTGTVAKTLGDTVNIVGGASTAGSFSSANISTTVDNQTGNLIIQMADNPVFTSATIGGTAGNTKLDNTGLTITNGPTVTTSGISAGSKKITNVADALLDSTSTEGVNGSQLYATNQKVLTNTQNITSLGDTINNINNKGTKYFHANSNGKDSSAIGDDSVAIGMGAQAGNANDVALGAGSQTSTAVGTATATIAGTVYNFAGQLPDGTLSV